MMLFNKKNNLPDTFGELVFNFCKTVCDTDIRAFDSNSKLSGRIVMIV